MTLADYLRQWLRDYGTANVWAKTLVGYTDVVERHLISSMDHHRLPEGPRHQRAFALERQRARRPIYR